MDDYLKEAIELARAQASVRVMSEEEISRFIATLASKLRVLAEGCVCVGADSKASAEDVKNSIKEKSVTCLECGKSFKVLTKRHLAVHNLTPEEYKAKYGMKKSTALICKAMQRERRKKMAEMQLWERRRKYAGKK